MDKPLKSKRYAAAILLPAAGFALSNMGCLPVPEESGPAIPPTAEELFIQAPESFLGGEPGIVEISSALLDAPELVKPDIAGSHGVCYTTDGALPVYNDICFDLVGDTLEYKTRILLTCDDGDVGDVLKTVRLRYQWDDGVEQPYFDDVTAQFWLNCVPPPLGAASFDVGGYGTIEGASDGTIDIELGDGLIDPATGNITFTAYVHAETTGVVTESRQQVQMTVVGSWDEPSKTLTDITATSKINTCQTIQDSGFPLFIDPCEQITLLEVNPVTLIEAGTKDLSSFFDGTPGNGSLSLEQRYVLPTLIGDAITKTYWELTE